MDYVKISWHNTSAAAEKDLLETLILGLGDKRIWLGEQFWDELRDILDIWEADDLIDWFLRFYIIWISKIHEIAIENRRSYLNLSETIQKMY